MEKSTSDLSLKLQSSKQTLRSNVFYPSDHKMADNRSIKGKLLKSRFRGCGASSQDSHLSPKRDLVQSVGQLSDLDLLLSNKPTLRVNKGTKTSQFFFA